MYLVDTNVISEARKRSKANKGVQDFFKLVTSERTPVFVSVVTVGDGDRKSLSRDWGAG